MFDLIQVAHKMDIIYLKDLETHPIVGVYAWERAVRQTISFDLEMASNIGLAAKTDDIAHALNYKEVADRVIAFVEKSQFQLIETLAEEVAELIMREFKVPWLRLKLSKAGAVRDVADLGLIIERGSLKTEPLGFG